MTDSQLASLTWCQGPCGAQDQIFVVGRQLQVCWYGAFSLTSGRVCYLQLLLAVTSTVILRSKSCGTHDHILLSQIQDSPNLEDIYIPQELGGPVIAPGTGFPLRCLLWLAGLQWRYLNLPLHGHWIMSSLFLLYILRADLVENAVSNSSSLVVCISIAVETSWHMLFTGRCLAVDGFSCWTILLSCQSMLI
jgi:hypothetical protein